MSSTARWTNAWCWRQVLCLAWSVAALDWGSPCRAQVAATAAAAPPVGTVQMRGAGLLVTTEVGWPEGTSYRPVRVSIAPLIPSKTDRLIVCEYRTRSIYGGQRTGLVRTEIVVPAGMLPVRVEIPVPEWDLANIVDFNFYEEGRELETLAHTTNTGMTGAWQYSEGLPKVLAIVPLGKALSGVDSTQLSQSLGGAILNTMNWMGQQQTKADVPLPTLVTRDTANLPEEWISYSGLDLVVVGLTEARQLALQSPGVWEALRRWTFAGGNLVIYDVPGTADGSVPVDGAVVDALLVPPEPGGSAAGVNVWTPADKSHYGNEIHDAPTGTAAQLGGAMNQAAAQALGQGDEDPSTVEDDEAEPVPVAPEVVPIAWRRFGLGRVVGWKATQAFPSAPADWAWVFNTLDANRWLWSRRAGQSLQRQNPDFWNFLIQGVGLAPVGAFQFLITAFVILIGPVNYFLLWRKQRQYLLILTAPLLALAVTTALFAYGIVADGFSLRARVRSFTWIDQPAARVTCWTRLSYYAGLAPSGGLTFPADLAVVPLGPVGGQALNSSTALRASEWSGEQHLISGWLPSRTPTQLTTVRSRTSQAGLDVAIKPEGQVEIVNRLGTAIGQLFLVDAEGNYHRARQLAAGATAALEPVAKDTVETELLDLLRHRRLLVPPGLDPSRQTTGLRGLRFVWSPGNLPEPTQRTGLLETGITEALVTDTYLRPGGYVALVEQSPEVVLGHTAVRVEEGWHVLAGRW